MTRREGLGGTMAEIAGRRMSAEINGDFVVFLIGARLDKLHPVQSLIDLGGRRGMKAHAGLPGRTPGKGTAQLPDGTARHRAVLAVLRSPGSVRQRRQRSSSGPLASVLETCRHERP